MSQRLFKDQNLSVTAALPNAANTVNSNSIDLGSETPYPVTEKFQVQIATTAGTGANTKNLNIVLQDSADGSNFANIPTLGAPAVQVVEANGSYPATTKYVALPPAVRRYIRASVTGEANGGNASTGTLTLSLVF